MHRLLLVFVLLFSLPALALDLDEAKQKGWVGEMPTGYLGLIDSKQIEAAKLITKINKKRKVKYQQIADKQKTALKNIELLAGEKLVNRAIAKGSRYASPNGDWQ